MLKKNTRPVKEVKKPYLTGGLTDENTVKKALKMFGLHIVIFFIAFVVCSLASFNNAILRIAVNLVVEVVCLLILFNKGRSDGTDAVARGEILWQRKEKGLEVTEGERRLSFHPGKGFLTCALGAVPYLILALMVTFTVQKQVTGYGTLPGWMSTFTRREEFKDALVAYTNTEGMNFFSLVRVFMRMCMMPVVNMIGGENRSMMLVAEKLCPLIILLPTISYGIGYLQGPKTRSRIHTEIAENIKKRKRKEKKERKARLSFQPKEPEQLN